MATYKIIFLLIMLTNTLFAQKGFQKISLKGMSSTEANVQFCTYIKNNPITNFKVNTSSILDLKEMVVEENNGEILVYYFPSLDNFQLHYKILQPMIIYIFLGIKKLRWLMLETQKMKFLFFLMKIG